MARSLTKSASFLRPIGKGSDELVAVKLHSNAVTLAEVRHKSNVINIDQLGIVGLPRRFDPQNLARQQDMIGEIIRTFRDQSGVTNRDAGIVLLGGIVSLRQLNFPYMTAAKEGRINSIADGGQTRRRIRRVYINHGDLVFTYKSVLLYTIRVEIIHVHRCGLYCGARHRGLGWGA